MDSKLQMNSKDKQRGSVYKYSFENDQQLYVVLSEPFWNGRYEMCVVMWNDGDIDSLITSVIGDSNDVKL